jgi:hypothetical protein
LSHIEILKAKRIKNRCVVSEGGSHTGKDLVLKHVEVEVDERGVLMSLLKAAWVKGNGEAIDGICQQVGEDCLGFRPLRQENVDRPYWVPAAPGLRRC